MAKIERATLEKLYGNIICTQEISIIDEEKFNDKKTHNLIFDVYDGIAYCENYKGKEYILEYPKKSFVKDMNKTLLQEVKKYNNLNEEDDITVSDIMAAFGVLNVI